MRTIYKYSLVFEDWQIVQMPIGAKILSFAEQNEQPVIWALVDPNAPVVEYRVRMVGTGHSFDHRGLKNVGTAQFQSGVRMFHLYIGLL